jgi:hypothetical protein
MSRTPASITQADIARSIRAAKQTGASSVEVRMGDGVVIRIALPAGKKPPDEPEHAAAKKSPDEPEREIVL